MSTASASVDIDPNGYSVSVDGRPGQAVGVNAAVTFGSLSTGTHLVQLGDLALNCSVSGTNPRSVDVNADGAASPVSFAVSCIAMTETGAGDWDY